MGGGFQDSIDKMFKETTGAGFLYKKMKSDKNPAVTAAKAMADSPVVSLTSRQQILGSLTQPLDEKRSTLMGN
jgi:hypothetical protein